MISETIGPRLKRSEPFIARLGGKVRVSYGLKNIGHWKVYDLGVKCTVLGVNYTVFNFRPYTFSFKPYTFGLRTVYFPTRPTNSRLL